ncbi:ATP12 family chaperone protein [Sandaracinobacter sp.]|uniref:ATP12 family chaperone protein n=1 Tax=Sandaracinobacter sp. TaxID=2487581 RepID=UPI0035B1AF36
MKRFWQDVAVVAGEPGHAVQLDGRPVKTPKGAPLALPTDALAEAVAAEWRAVEGELNPADMPLTGLANAAIDLVGADLSGFADGLARYGESDMLCYRADHPEPLVERQKASWQPILDWAAGRFDLAFAVTAGVVHVAQPVETLTRIAAAYRAFGPFDLAALSPLVTLSGSAVVPLALAHGALPVEAAWAAAILDEAFQAELWGEDGLAAANRADRQRQFEAAARFLRLASGGNFGR